MISDTELELIAIGNAAVTEQGLRQLARELLSLRKTSYALMDAHLATQRAVNDLYKELER